MQSKSSSTIAGLNFRDVELLAEIHPGRTIEEDYLDPLGMSIHALAIALEVPANRMNEILRGKRGSLPIQPCASGESSARRLTCG